MSENQQAQGFNFRTAKAIVAREAEGTDLPITGVDGKPLFYQDGDDRKPVTIRVIGSYSPTFRQLMTDRQQLAKRLGHDPSAEEERAADLDMLAKCCTAWAGFFDGEPPNVVPLEFSEANVRMVIASVPWIEAQIDKAAVAHDRFFGASAAA